MIPGIWFEMEVCGEKATAFDMGDHFLKRDGIPITVAKRRFWDFRDPFVVAYLQEKVIDFLVSHGIGYLKLDYNDSLGIGCDGAESLGEGLRQQMVAVQRFIRRIQEAVPNIVMENCASGGHRLEPSMLALTSMSSFSDAHECAEIPIIAANLHRVMLPRQSQIWAVLRKADTPQRLVYSLANTMIGRMCLSGDIHDLNEEQWRIVDEGVDFYKKAAPVIREGKTRRYGTPVRTYRHPQGWQGIVRYADNGSRVLVVIHRFAASSSEWIQVPIPEGERYDIADVFADGRPAIRRTHDQLSCRLDDDFSAVCVRLQQS
jgi:alpha-galactosidase